ncbi:MAG: HEAT repeat domain-containing protein [Pirellulales bacterium]
MKREPVASRGHSPVWRRVVEHSALIHDAGARGGATHGDRRQRSSFAQRSVARGRCWAAIGLLVALPVAGPLSADTVVLRQGGQVRGSWLNRHVPPPEVYVIRTETGGEVRLHRSQVKRVVQRSAAAVELETLRITSPDTVDGHWKLAQWCAAHKLGTEYRFHLQRIVELSPDHAEARRRLGYRRVGDRWMSRDEEMAARGFRRYKGQYLTEHHIAVREKEHAREVAEKEWFKKIKRWRSWLVGKKLSKIEQGRRNIVAIRDPAATAGLIEALRRERQPRVKLLLIEALAQVAAPGQEQVEPGRTAARSIASPAALEALVAISLRDPNPEIRMTCLDYLVDIKRPDVARFYYDALRSKDNVEVNRAAAALKTLGSQEAIGPLIDALLTTHKFRVGGGNPGQTSASFSADGGSSFGQSGPRIEKRTISNHEVLGALVALSGQNFEFRVDDWNAWYAVHRRSQRIDARRD